jgi:tetratricopeptide (TPR) repeat protein
MTNPAAISPRPWRLPLVLVVISLLVAAGLGVWLYLQPRPNAVSADLVGAALANTKGIGFMEQFQYSDAVQAFEEAVRLAPDWTPAQINLGIALLNTEKPENLDRALEIFQQVRQREPNNIHAHYCTAIIHQYRGNLGEALPHFERVTQLDPLDAHAWYFLGISRPDSAESPDSYRCFEHALKLNPYLNAARYALAQHRITGDDPKRKKQLIEEFQALGQANATDLLDIKYTEMGRYGTAIGSAAMPALEQALLPLFEPVPGLSIQLAEATAWATSDLLPEAYLVVRTRFGGGMVLLDYNRDGRMDVFLPGAVIRQQQVGDVLLRNDGNFTFTDVTALVGLHQHAGTFAAAVGDFDNDSFPDLALCGPAGIQLFQNQQGTRFSNVTSTARFDHVPGFFLTASWIDLDQDGDLDLVAARYASTAELAVQHFRGGTVDGTGRLVVFANTGVAPAAAKPGDPLPPLTVSFKEAAEPEALLVKGPVTGLVATDVDGDLDVDLLVLVDGQPPVTVLNDRMFRFHQGPPITSASGKWNGGLVLDINGDDQSDLVLLENSAPPRVLISTTDQPGGDLGARFIAGTSNSPSLLTAAWVDLDLDGRTDVTGLSTDRKLVLLRGDGKGKFTRELNAFGTTAEAIADALAVIPIDLTGECRPDILVWSARTGLQLFKNLGNGNHGLRVVLTGKRKPLTIGEEGKPLRTNADGVGTWVRVHAGPLRTAAENTTLFAGLGQSRIPIHFGLGKQDFAEAIRVRWPDAVIQAELNQGGSLVNIVEFDRKPTSCPILFTWNGERFVYNTDFLGAGSMGESGANGTTRPPRPEESVKIEPGQLAPRNGHYVLKLAEPMDELMYLDRIRLDVIDHPGDVIVFPDERFATSDPQPSQQRLYFRESECIFATKATDHRGQDVTNLLRYRDGRHVEGFALRSWLGYAEDHYVEFTLPAAIKSVPAGRPLYLVLAGWTDYAFPESIYAATQAGVPPLWPVLEQHQPDGSWKTLGEIGLPAGLSRVMTTEITGWFDVAGGPLRIRTNLRIYWDQLFIAPLSPSTNAQVQELSVARAILEHRGFVQEYSPGGKLPIAYDYDRLEAVAVTRWRGKITRTGDVTELLNTLDDCPVICGPGDEITAEFAAEQLPKLPLGWKRSFILRSWGYVKDGALTTQTAGQVGPLPYREMPAYPYDPLRYPLPQRVKDYDRKWNTRTPGRR